MSEFFEIITASIYDTLALKRGQRVKRLEFFRHPFSQNKSLEETSMFLPSQLPEPQEFEVHSLAVSELNGEMPWRLFRSGVLELIIGCKSYAHFSPLAMLYATPEGLLVSGRDMRPLRISLGQNFAVFVYWVQPMKCERDFRIRVQLNGELHRPVC